MSYEVKIDAFEGPIDLLLHLVEKEEMEIKEVKLAEITEQYLDYLSTMQELDLDVASEFLVMATQLMEMKVQVLLPGGEKTDTKSEDTNPREKLIHQLLEYKKYKSLASKLQQFEQQQKQSYTRNVAPLLSELEFPDHNPLENVEVDDFVEAFQTAFADYQQRKQEEETAAESEPQLTHLRPEDVTVEEQQAYLRQRVNKQQTITFNNIFSDLQTKIEIIVTFMALLELIKQQEVRVEQEANFAQIKLYQIRSGNCYEQAGS